MNFLWTNVDQPPAYQTMCKTFQSCPGSIDIKGSYLVGLYSTPSSNYCQTFTENVANLNTEPILGAGNLSTSFDKIYIIPTIGASGGSH